MNKEKGIFEKTVAIIIPCLNEEAFIGPCLDSILNNGYPLEVLDIVIIDGLSTDRTRAIVRQYQEKYSCVRMIDNPGAVKPKGLNLGIRESKGDVVIRIDAHAIYEQGYIEKAVYYLYNYDATSVGGVRVNLPRSDTFVAKCLAHALSNPFAVGNAWYNLGCVEPRKVDILFLFCVKRTLFDEIGYFDERLIRGQDREFNLRIQRHGGLLLLVPEIKSKYFARDSLEKFAKWGYVGGATPVLISRLTGKNLLSLRNIVPLIFLCVAIMLGCLSLFFPAAQVLLFLLFGAYLFPAFYFSIRVVRKEQSILYMLGMPVIFVIYHFTYGVGTMTGMIKPLPRETNYNN